MVSRTLSRLKREGGISLEMPQQKTASSRLEGKISWVFSSCGSKLWFPLELRWGPQGPAGWPQESPVSGRVAKGLSGFLCSLCRGQGPHLVMRLELQRSSPVLTMTSGFLWSFHRGVRPRLKWRHPSPLSFLSCQSSVRLPVVFT